MCNLTGRCLSCGMPGHNSVRQIGLVPRLETVPIFMCQFKASRLAFGSLWCRLPGAQGRGAGSSEHVSAALVHARTSSFQKRGLGEEFS